MRHHERTVKKYSDIEDWSEERTKTTRRSRVIWVYRPAS